MISSCLIEAEKDPAVHIGGILDSIGGTTRIGKSGYFVTEACEYKDSFLKFRPYVGVVLNIEPDHLDYFRDIEHIQLSFSCFADQIQQKGFFVGNADDERVSLIMKKLGRRAET